MKFRYEFDIKRLPYPVTHRHNLFLIGSCFTENIGEKLRRHKFRTMENPNGILFNPVSVSEAIINYINNKQYTRENLFHYNEAWHSWQHHSRFSGLTAEEALDKTNTSTQQAHQYLGTASHVLITLGSSWLYTLTEEAPNGIKGNVAANNHKGPSAWFHKRLMSAEETIALLDNMLQTAVIFTISPVRHLREGAIENNRSKAVLIQAVHALVEKQEALYYFPAYELVIDDLRDYRFYAEDLAHPNYQATQYVWEKDQPCAPSYAL
ncbi:GSCFA domain-containing protein [Russula earlei]|uniref:GSCFA domain-containing protein n=1 Tax=Russula earlei TaxID=71964 RepID=A0ACC0TQI4_9AGAM|nr:GSCFA domain-containing protein [Russula earlei]